MTAKRNKPRAPKVEDEEQSRRFFDLAKELQDAGELSPTDEGEAFDKAFRKVSRARRRTPG
ncbi:MAG TPA: hypothetical protein VN694_13330 [Caulobacteraceae bacterium]|nr:hypothetical protein [Caulobacteraceae bacterium]